MENNYYIYIYTRLDNNTIFYVGKGKDDRYKTLSKRNNHFMGVINKVPYKVEFLYDNLTEEQALQLEKDTIHNLVFNEDYGIDIKDYYKPNSIKHLCNQTWGGEGTSGYNHTEEAKKKMSEINSGESNPFYGKNHTEEWKQQMSEIMKVKNSGENSPFYGCHHTEEAKKKVSEANSGRKHTEEAKKKMSKNHWDCSGSNNPNYGLKGELSPSYGLKRSEETKMKISENSPKKRKVICVTTKKIFNSVTKASKFYNCDNSGITKVCKNKRNYCGKLSDGTKLVWRYLNHKHNIILRGTDISKLHKDREVA